MTPEERADEQDLFDRWDGWYVVASDEFFEGLAGFLQWNIAERQRDFAAYCWRLVTGHFSGTLQ